MTVPIVKPFDAGSGDVPAAAGGSVPDPAPARPGVVKHDVLHHPPRLPLSEVPQGVHARRRQVRHQADQVVSSVLHVLKRITRVGTC